MRHVISLTEVGPQNLSRLVDDALAFAARPEVTEQPLRGKSAASTLGGHPPEPAPHSQSGR